MTDFGITPRPLGSNTGIENDRITGDDSDVLYTHAVCTMMKRKLIYEETQISPVVRCVDVFDHMEF